MKVTTQDMYDKDGNLTHIEVLDEKGDFVMLILWDPTDEQTTKNRVAFRKWAHSHLKQAQNYEVIK
jgi:hypothetical protein